MSTFYPTGCDDALLTHICAQCPETELGRVRRVGFVNTSWAFSDITDAQEWEDGINAEKIVIIPETRGSYDGGTTNFGPGFGDVPQKKKSKTFKVTYFDPNLKGNDVFYNALANSRNWRIAFVSETLLQISEKAVTLEAKDPIEEDVESERYFNLEATFVQKDNPLHYLAPSGIFRCFQIIN